MYRTVLVHVASQRSRTSPPAYMYDKGSISSGIFRINQYTTSWTYKKRIEVLIGNVIIKRILRFATCFRTISDNVSIAGEC